MNYDEPAFPVNFANDTEWPMEDPFGRELPAGSNSQYVGLTKRDYFAIRAMQSLLTSPNCPKSINEELLVSQSFRIANAMIKESNKND